MYPVNFSAFMTEEDTLHAIGETRRMLEDIYQCWEKQGTSKARVVALDKTVDEVVTFLKLNVEGPEAAALEGAKRTISAYRSKIAASVDHLPDDLITIPEKIRGIESGYEVFIRHHSNEYWGAYLYARPKS
jgi:hypothetical protein